MSASTPQLRAADAASPDARAELEGLRIVIVDDDGDARELLAAVLEQRRATVFAADCAARAFVLVEREQPDALISDIAMPDEDGYSLVERVRALPRDKGGRTPSIAVTAQTGNADRERAMHAGFDAHFAKPIDVDSLVGKLVDICAARDQRLHIVR